MTVNCTTRHATVLHVMARHRTSLQSTELPCPALPTLLLTSMPYPHHTLSAPPSLPYARSCTPHTLPSLRPLLHPSHPLFPTLSPAPLTLSPPYALSCTPHTLPPYALSCTPHTLPSLRSLLHPSHPPFPTLSPAPPPPPCPALPCPALPCPALPCPALPQANSCVKKACLVSGVSQMRVLPTCQEHGWALQPEVLEAAIREDVAQGLLPFFICV